MNQSAKKGSIPSRKSTISLFVKENSAKSNGKRTEVVFELVTLSKEQLNSSVRVSKYNPRNQSYMSQESLASLRADIKKKGTIIEPAWGYSMDGYIQLMDGSRRYRCAVLDDHDLKIWVTKSALTPEQVKAITTSFSEQAELSLIERGALWQQWLDDGLFSNKQSIAMAEQKSATIVTRAIQAHNLRDTLKNCYRDPTTFGAAIINKLNTISETLNNSNDYAAVLDFEQKLTWEIDPEIIEHEMHQKARATAIAKAKKEAEAKGYENAFDASSIKAEASMVSINTFITKKIEELFNTSSFVTQPDKQVTEHRKGRLRMTHDTDGKALTVSFENMQPTRQRFALDVNAAVLNSTKDVKTKAFTQLDERAAELLRVIEESDDQFKDLDSVERKRLALLFSEVISTRHSTTKADGENITSFSDEAKKRAANHT